MTRLAARKAEVPRGPAGPAGPAQGLAAVTLRYEPGHVTVSIADSGRRPGERAPGANGHGTAKPGPLLAGSGLGLAGIAERVASCGGNLTVGPTGSGGFTVTARLPAR